MGAWDAVVAVVDALVLGFIVWALLKHIKED